MPELPEVETIKRGLDQKIKGKTISDVLVLDKKILELTEKKFLSAIKNSKIENIERRAKNLIITLSNGPYLLLHLKMTGQLLFSGEIKSEKERDFLANPEFRHARLVFFFKGGGALVFNDLRRFGYVKLIAQADFAEVLGAKKLGPEPLEKDFTIDKFKGILKKYPKRKIKQVLMDQTAIAGIGNIYSDEICFYAKVSPLRPAGKLSEAEISRIYEGVKKILSKAIELRGTSVGDYLDASGEKGGYAKELKVYGREKEKCLGCGETIKRIKIGGRSSFYCPKCQK